MLPVYQSDIDLLLVLKKGKYAGYQAINLEHNIEKRLDRKFSIDITQNPLASMPALSVTLILEPIHFVNNQLEKGQYFFRDIRQDCYMILGNLYYRKLRTCHGTIADQ